MPQMKGDAEFMRSMTGCGTGRIQRNGWEVTAELKTVNHRFLDLSMRLPRNISFLEPVVRKTAGEELKRGHVDVYLTVRNTEASSLQITVDRELALQYWEAGKGLSETTGAENDLGVSRLLAMEGVTTLTAMREKEGAHLREDLRTHLGNAAVLRGKILARAPHVAADYREKLEGRLKNALIEGV